MKNYVSKIQELETELMHVRNSTLKGDGYIDSVALDKDKFQSPLDDLAFGSNNELDEPSKFLTPSCVFQN